MKKVLYFVLLMSFVFSLNAVNTAEFNEEQGIDVVNHHSNAGSRTARDIPDDGLLLIPDSGDDRVMAFDPTTGDLYDADFIPSDPTNLATPIAAALHPDGNSILVSDQLNDGVMQYDLNGNFMGWFAPAGGVNTSILDNVRGWGLKADGNILVTTAGGANSDAIAEFDASGNYVSNFIAPNSTIMDSPFCILYRETEDDYLVTASTSDAVHQYDNTGAYVGNLVPTINFPEQVSVCSNGNLLVAGFSTPSGVYEFTSTGTQVGYYDIIGSPRGVYELPNGNILVTNGSGVYEIDRSNNLVSTKIDDINGRFIYFVEGSGGGGTTTVFEDDFESGLTNWVLEADPAANNTWDLVDGEYHSVTHSLTESPGGNYSPDVTYTATIASPLDFSAAMEASLNFWMKYDIEGGLFDFLYIDVSPDNGATWVNIGTYYGEGNDWDEYTISLGGFVGNSQVLIRWQIVTDGGYEVNGMYLDDVVVSTSDVDNTPPLILHNGPEFYEGTDEDFTFEAEIIDISGLASADVVYTVEGGTEQTLASTGNTGNIYSFTIPFNNYGDQIDYKVVAVDASPQSNEGETGINSYIEGTHLIYDSGVVDYYITFEEGTGAAVKMLNPAGMDLNLDFALIRNYTDTNNANDDFEFHVWDDNGGVPGNDLITPFIVTPEATLTNNSPMTRIDLRSYSAQLNDIQGDFYIGFMIPTGVVACTETSPGSFVQSYTWNGSTWTLDDADFHFRSVVELVQGVVPGTIEGVVTDTDTGDFIEGALVTAGVYSTTTDASGEYSFAVDPDTYDVECSYDGYDTSTQTGIVVTSGNVEQVDFALQHMYNPPESLTYTYTAPNVILQWTAPVGPGLTGYNIYRNDEVINTVTALLFIDPNLSAGTYTYYITAVYGDYESIPSNEVEVEVPVGNDPNLLPTVTKLNGNYPNPFNPNTLIQFSVAEQGHVSIEIYNIKGEKVSTLRDGEMEAGNYSVPWNGRDDNGSAVASGVYFYKMKADKFVQTKKMILMK